MAISVNQYAKALYASVEKKSAEDIDGAVANFLKLLQKNGQMKLVKKIAEKFSDIWNKENGIVEATVITARNNNQETITKIKELIKEKYNAKEVVLKNTIDEKIKGGFIIKVGDEMIDASVERKLATLKNCLN